MRIMLSFFFIIVLAISSVAHAQTSIPPSTSITDPAGHVWTVQAATPFDCYIDGVQAANCWNVKVLFLYGGSMYVSSLDGTFWKWSGNGWWGVTDPRPAGTAAIKANDFLNSLGANTHIGQGDNEATYEPMFKYTGVRHARDDGRVAVTTGAQSGVIFHANTGVTFDIIAASGGAVPQCTAAMAVANNANCWNTNAAQIMVAAGALDSVEGPNEPNNARPTYNGVAIWLGVAQYQADLYAGMKAIPALANIPVFNLSEGGAESANVGLQCIRLDSSCVGAAAVTLMPAGTIYADYATVHNYASGTGQFAPNMWWNSTSRTSQPGWDNFYSEYVKSWGGFLGYSAAQAPNIPLVGTETSWGSWTGNGVSESDQGKFALLMYLDSFKQGFFRAYWYEMWDGSGGDGSGSGFYTQNLQLPKMAAFYMHNLTTILADTSSAFTAGSAAATISSEPVTVHDMLMQKSNGAFEWAIWDEQFHTKPQAVDDIIAELGATYAVVNVYDPTVDIAPVATYTNVSSIALTLSDHPLIVEFYNTVTGYLYDQPPTVSPTGWGLGKVALTQYPSGGGPLALTTPTGKPYAVMTNVDTTNTSYPSAGTWFGNLPASNYDFVQSTGSGGPLPGYPGAFTQIVWIYVFVTGPNAWQAQSKQSTVAFMIDSNPNIQTNSYFEALFALSVPPAGGSVQVLQTNDYYFIPNPGLPLIATITANGWYGFAATWSRDPTGNGYASLTQQVIDVNGNVLGSNTENSTTILSSSLMGTDALELSWQPGENGFAGNQIAVAGAQAYLGSPQILH